MLAALLLCFPPLNLPRILRKLLAWTLEKGADNGPASSRVYNRGFRRPDLCKGHCERYESRRLESHSARNRTSNGVLTCPLGIGVLHTIFFHRYFPPVRPALYTPTASSSHTSSHSVQSLPIPLPSILDPPEISAAIDSHTALLVSQLTPQSAAGAAAGGSRGEIVVRFFDRKRRKTGITAGWLGRLGGGGGQTEEEVCWEEWCVQVVVARPRSEAGE